MSENQKMSVRGGAQIQHITDMLEPAADRYEIRVKLESEDVNGAKTMAFGLLEVVKAFMTGGNQARETLYATVLKLKEEAIKQEAGE